MSFYNTVDVKNLLVNTEAKFNFIKSVSGVLPQVVEQDNYDSTNSNKVLLDSLPSLYKFNALNLKFETTDSSKYRNLYISVLYNSSSNAPFTLLYSSDCKWAEREFDHYRTSYASDMFEIIFKLLDKYRVDPAAIQENVKFS